MTTEQQIKAIEDLIASITKTRLTPQQTTAMFKLYNEMVRLKLIKGPHEYGDGCGSCGTRVFNRLKNHLKTIKPQ